MAKYHERMPAIVEERDFDDWLTGRSGKEILQPAPENMLQEWLVSKRVNKTPPRDQPDDDATLIEPI